VRCASGAKFACEFAEKTKSTLDVRQYASRVDVCPFQPFFPIPYIWGCKETQFLYTPFFVVNKCGFPFFKLFLRVVCRNLFPLYEKALLPL